MSTALGVAGMFFTCATYNAFLLLATACFIRTSPKFYNWLVAHPKLGRYLVYYLDGKGVPLKAKIYTLLVLWGSIILTAFVLLNSFIALHFAFDWLWRECLYLFLTNLAVGKPSKKIRINPLSIQVMVLVMASMFRYFDWVLFFCCIALFYFFPELDLAVSHFL